MKRLTTYLSLVFKEHRVKTPWPPIMGRNFLLLIKITTVMKAIVLSNTRELGGKVYKLNCVRSKSLVYSPVQSVLGLVFTLLLTLLLNMF